jgi:cytochrome bd-type quinol oxidase subunit 2
MINIKKIFKYNTGLPYYINHLIIALFIGIIFGNLFAGATFYIGREIRDWEKLGHFDHKGFWIPVIPCIVLQILYSQFIC